MIVHVICDDNVLFFAEMRAMLMRHERTGPHAHIIASRPDTARIAHTRVLTPKQMWESDFLDSKGNQIVFWGDCERLPEILSKKRKAKIGFVWSEGYDTNRHKLMKACNEKLDYFMTEVVPKIDITFAHTPKLVESIKRAFDYIPHIRLLPLGWDAEVMGGPRWSGKTKHLVSWYGTPVNRRFRIMGWIADRLGDQLSDLSRLFGRRLYGELDVSRVVLHVQHSLIESYPTWRMWQGACTNAIMVCEKGDTWPFESGVHYNEIPIIDEMNIDEICRMLTSVESIVDTRKDAFDLVQQYSIDRVDREYLRPAFEEL